jgi:uncharacterized protein YndB with AHSA1/START domain
MNKQGSAGSSSSNTVCLHRVLAAKPDKVYRAFTTADAMARWLPPNGFTCTVHQLDSKVGGTYRMSFTNFTTGKTHSFGGKYLDLVPDELIRYTDRFEDPNLLGEMIATVTLRPSRSRPVISAGSSRSITSPRSSSPRSRTEAESDADVRARANLSSERRYFGARDDSNAAIRVQKADLLDHPDLLDHLVSAQQNRCRHVEPASLKMLRAGLM